MNWIVDVLLQDEEGVKEPERLKNIQEKKREALESLSYVRDVLNGGITNVEEERLWSEQEFRRRSRELAPQHTRGTSSSFPRHDNQLISKPPPASISEIRGSRQSTALEHKPSFTSSRSLHSHSTVLSASAPASSPPPVSVMRPTKSNVSGSRPTAPQTLPQWASLPQRPPPASSTLHSSRATPPTSPPSTVSKTFVQYDPLGAL